MHMVWVVDMCRFNDDVSFEKCFNVDWYEISVSLFCETGRIGQKPGVSDLKKLFHISPGLNDVKYESRISSQALTVGPNRLMFRVIRLMCIK
jgi:hypothetical protein